MNPILVLVVIGATLGILLVVRGRAVAEKLCRSAFALSLPFAAFAVDVGGVGVQFSFLLGVVLLVIFLSQVFEFRETLGRWCASPISAGLLVFAAAATTSVVMSAALPQGRLLGETPWLRGGKQTLAVFIALGLHLAVVSSVRRVSHGSSFARGYTLAAALVAGFAIYQVASIIWELNLPGERLGGNNLSILGEVQWERTHWKFVGGLPRIGATLVEPSFLGAFLSSAVFFPLAELTLGFRAIFRTRIATWVCAIVILIALLLTSSIGSYMAFGAGMLILSVVAMRMGRGGKVFLLATTACCGLVVLWAALTGLGFQAGETAVQRLLVEDPERADTSLLGRTGSLLAAVEMFRRHPLLGVGIGNYGFYEAALGPSWLQELEEVRGGFPAPLSLYTQILAETGLIGTVAFVGFLGVSIWSGFRVLRRRREATIKCVTAGAVAGFVAMAVAHVGIAGFHNFPYLFVLAGHLAAQESVIDDRVHGPMVASPHYTPTVSAV